MQSFRQWAEQNVPTAVNIEIVKEKLKKQAIETPSWGYGDSGTRFQVFSQAGVARNVYEKIDDAAQVHNFTGITPSIALHIPWDRVDDYLALKDYALVKGLHIGAINPNLFQENEYKLGSLTNYQEGVRSQAIAHLEECIEIMKKTDSFCLSLWLADGTNYPGQADFRMRKHYLEDSLQYICSKLAPYMLLLLEYKFFEPAFYHTDIADWGMATVLAKKLGSQAKTLVDLGHHPLGTNIEQIVAFLIDEGKLGGFHFNSRKYADDDLTSGSINPHELFLIYNELIAGEQQQGLDIVYMIDQSHNLKPKVEAMIQSVINIQTAFAKALLVDRKALREFQRNGDIIQAEETLSKAYQLDVEPLLVQVRQEMGLHEKPLSAYRNSGYYELVCETRR